MMSTAAAAAAQLDESDPLGHIPMFAPLTLEERGELSRLLKPRRFTPGQHIVWVGEPGREFFVIEQGSVNITLPDEQGRELILATLGRGSSSGRFRCWTAGRGRRRRGRRRIRR